MTFGKEFTRLRERKGLDQITVARALNVDTAYLSRVANDAKGHVPAEDRIHEMASILRASQEETDSLFFAAQKLPPDIARLLSISPSAFDLIRGLRCHLCDKIVPTRYCELCELRYCNEGEDDDRWCAIEHDTQHEDRLAGEIKTYIASRASIPERAAMWRKYRDAGIPITSSWIDEDGEGQTQSLEDLWIRIAAEVSESDRIVLYAEHNDFPLKGALIEVGMALGMAKPVIVCLPGVELDPRSCRPIGSWISHPLVERNDRIDDVLGIALSRI